jgi:hypothetical protein
MLPILRVIAGAFALASVSGLGKNATYTHKTEERQEMIRKLRDEGHDWKQIALTLNTAGYRNKDGGTLTEYDVREEFAKMTVEEVRLSINRIG